jgi:hypothetical protein
MTEVREGPALTEEQIDQMLQGVADAFSVQRRSPVMHSPDELGLDYEDVTFPSRDGVPLEGWFILAAGSNRLIIANHPMGFTRSGMPTQLEPWHSAWAASGNGFEVDFVPDYEPDIPVGVKGAGEIGIVGTAAAIANAAHHATGIRVRDLPLTADDFLR